MSKYELPEEVLWVDVETTGLGPGTALVEVALAVTDSTPHLVVREIASWVVRPPAAAKWDDWALSQHGRSGLSAAAWGGAPAHVVESGILSEFDFPAVVGPMGGSSPHFDRAVLEREMPALAARWNHRNFDVSTMLAAASVRGCGEPPAGVPSDMAQRRGSEPHRAAFDVARSISLARWALTRP